jgi:hypothetical protein
MDLAALKEWLVPISTSGGIVAAAWGALIALRDYKLKLQAETRLAQAAQVEADVKLLNLFIEIMNVAHARGPSVLASEKLFEVMLPKLQADGNMNVKDAAIITFPIGAASQDAAIAAIGELGKRHTLLRSAAFHALQSLAAFKPNVAKPVLEELEAFSNGCPTSTSVGALTCLKNVESEKIIWFWTVFAISPLFLWGFTQISATAVWCWTWLAVWAVFVYWKTDALTKGLVFIVASVFVAIAGKSLIGHAEQGEVIDMVQNVILLISGGVGGNFMSAYLVNEQSKEQRP